MLLRLFLAAFAAGAIAGLAITVVQHLTTVPLILEAETFEHGGPAEHARKHAGTPAARQSGSEPVTGLARIALTALTNLILAIGFALVLNGCFALHGRPVGGREGILWGLAGFAVFTLGPAIGLPPELPGMARGALLHRQGWWFLAAACTGGGLWLLAFRRGVAAKIGGVILLALPSVVGAPHPDGTADAVPAALASRFAATSIVVSAIFWSTLGWLTATFYARFARLGSETEGQAEP